MALPKPQPNPKRQQAAKNMLGAAPATQNLRQQVAEQAIRPAPSLLEESEYDPVGAQMPMGGSYYQGPGSATMSSQAPDPRYGTQYRSREGERDPWYKGKPGLVGGQPMGAAYTPGMFSGVVDHFGQRDDALKPPPISSTAFAGAGDPSIQEKYLKESGLTTGEQFAGAPPKYTGTPYPKPPPAKDLAGNIIKPVDPSKTVGSPEWKAAQAKKADEEKLAKMKKDPHSGTYSS